MAIFGENVFGDFGENVFGDFGETVFGDFGENVFGDNVGELEDRGRRSYGEFILEFVMEKRRAQRS